MKETNTTEGLFDQVFEQGLANVSSPVPSGVWEGISSSIGSSAGSTAAMAVKTALWMKAAIGVVAISALAMVTYKLSRDDDQKTTVPQVTVPLPSETKTPKASALPENAINKNLTLLNASKTQATPGKHIPENSSALNDENAAWNTDPIVFDDGFSKMIQKENFSATKSGSEQSLNLSEEEKASLQTLDQNSKEAGNQNIPESPEYTYVSDSSQIFVPNAVTPDGDGINDVYLITLVGEEKVEIIIYSIDDNSILFRTTNKYIGWNCNMPNGDPAPAGTYFVKVIYKFKNKPESKPIVRKLTLIK